MSILYVDDDADDREVFIEALKKISPEVICYEARDGIEGFKILHSLITPPAAIFLDVNMPKMNGKQFLMELGRISAFRSIPVFMYSTSNDCQEQSEYISMGAKGFLMKRSSFAQICETLRDALRLSERYLALLVTVLIQL